MAGVRNMLWIGVLMVGLRQGSYCMSPAARRCCSHSSAGGLKCNNLATEPRITKFLRDTGCDLMDVLADVGVRHATIRIGFAWQTHGSAKPRYRKMLR
jgi:hypothetical protein